MLPKDQLKSGPPVRRSRKSMQALNLVNEQYQQLREKLHSVGDVREKNVIYRRLINLLEVMEFLNSNSHLPN